MSRSNYYYIEDNGKLRVIHENCLYLFFEFTDFQVLKKIPSTRISLEVYKDKIIEQEKGYIYVMVR